MDRNSKLYKEITPSAYAWEREAIEFVRSRLPDHEPYRLWSNFEFVAQDGSINEVDLLAVTPSGIHVIEIKSRPGTVTADQSTFEWHDDGRIFTSDSPLLVTDRKCKKLKGLLTSTRAFRKHRCPYVQPWVFLSHESNKRQGMPEHIEQWVHLRDVSPDEGNPRFPNGRNGILAAINPPRGSISSRNRVDKPIAKAIARALDEIGLRPSLSARRVGDYKLEELLYEGPNYQDWRASHQQLERERARIRIYQVERGASEETRESTERAAKREYTILSGISHEGILTPKQFTSHDRGPALVFEHHENAQRLDHYLRERGARLEVDTRLHLLRRIAETVAYAHEKRLIHRALAPQSVLLLDPESLSPKIKIFNWQTGQRDKSTAASTRLTLFGHTGTLHVQEMSEDQSLVYMAPEVLTRGDDTDEACDVFSLGAIAYHLFANEPPAPTLGDLQQRIQRDGSLELTARVDGAVDGLVELVDVATKGNVTARYGSVQEFLEGLELVEEELTDPSRDKEFVEDPTLASKGDQLPGGFVVEKRLGKGSSAVALLVEHEGKQRVLKIAIDPSHSRRLEDEAEALRKLKSPRVVTLLEKRHFGDRAALLLESAGNATLADRLRQDGPLQPELLERFGRDLLEAVAHLEEQGISHRDIKPENLGIAKVGRGDELHLMIFDFSLAKEPAESLDAGTRGYLDPFLRQEGRKRFDLHAERFAASITLYQMATGTLPQWGDGHSAPWAIQDEVTIEAELFAPELRESMLRFFEKALRRDYRERFDTIEEMRDAWRSVFAEKPIAQGPKATAEVSVDEAELTTPVSLLVPSARSLHALERAAVLTVEDLLRIPLSRLTYMRGVGRKTRGEIERLRHDLVKRFPDVRPDPGWKGSEKTPVPTPDDVALDVEQLGALLLPKRIDKRNRSGAEAIQKLLSLDPIEGASTWPSQSEVADAVGVTRARIGQILKSYRERWLKIAALTALRDEMEALLTDAGGVMMSHELAEALLASRGSSAEASQAMQTARAVVRAALEAESQRAVPRWVQRRPRDGRTLFVALHAVDDQGNVERDGDAANDYARRLGERAEHLAEADPLLPPTRALERLQEVPRPDGLPALKPLRLRRLAVAASVRAALSSTFEIYPVGMRAARALRLSLGALSGASKLTPAELRERVDTRYPKAEKLPERPELDSLLEEVGSPLEWDDGEGAYQQPSGIPTSYRTSYTRVGVAEATATEDEYERAQFDQRLANSLREGRFLALIASHRRAEDARAQLAEHYDVEVLSLDALLLEAMREVCEDWDADWDTVREADRNGPEDWENWGKLIDLVSEAVPRVRQRLASAERPVLIVHPGLLARYDQLAFLAELRDVTGTADGPPAAWVLVAGEPGKPEIDGKPLPLFQRAQWADVPRSLTRGRTEVRTNATEEGQP